jgi:cell division protease FtsH
MARKMVCEWGMSSLGPLTFGKKEEQIFLGREINQHRDFSEETALKIDAEVRRFVDEAYAKSKQLLEEHRETVATMAAALLEREVLDASEIKLLLEGKPLPARELPPSSSDSGGVQQVLRPEATRTPGLNPGERPSHA